MLQLIGVQRRFAEQLRKLRRSALIPPPCLIYGAKGVGKRTAVRGLCANAGLHLVEVNVADNPQLVRQRLFGSQRDAANADEFGIFPGECGSDDGTVLYLSGLHNADPELHQELHTLIASRQYRDAMGRRWPLDDTMGLVAAITVDNSLISEAGIGLSHWLCTAFKHVVQVDLTENLESFVQVCSIMALEYEQEWAEQPDATLHRIAKTIPDRLHAVRRSIANTAITGSGAKKLTRARIQRQLFNDLQALLTRVPYRAQPLTAANFEKWAIQFGEHRALAITIIRQVVERYYISSQEYFQGINSIISKCEIPKRSAVTFCSWQNEGNSAPRMAHIVKNQAHWKLTGASVDLRTSPVFVDDSLNSEEEHWLILLDDFTGSGRTLEKLFNGSGAPMSQVLRILPRARLVIGVIAGYRDALQKVLSHTTPYGDRVKVVPHRVFDDRDKCFSDDSQVFPDAGARLELKELCKEVASKFFRGLRGKNRFGYGGVGSLVVFSDTVPNNSLPILWYDNSDWIPLFPASGLPIFDEKD